MRILSKDLKKGYIKLQAQTNEDLWYLSQIIEQGDLVKGEAERKIKLGGSEEKTTVVKKKVFVEIQAEKIEYDVVLRVLGTIVECPDDLPKGSHQNITVEPHSVIAITKEWLSIHLEKLKQAQEQKINMLLVLFDREHALFVVLDNTGTKMLAEVSGNVNKKNYENSGNDFFKELAKEIEAYQKRFATIIAASPSFWNDYLLKELKNKEGIIFASCSEVSESAVREVLKRPELKNALEQSRIASDETLMQRLLGEVAKNNAFYGVKEAEEKISSGNVTVLMVSEHFLKEAREKKNYKDIEQLMKTAEKMHAELHILESKQLDGLGGIAGILRWKDYKSS
ncbi:hypothetical protein C4573_04910 [Candidatus Woesearchaeota archaeon]|nr:MAG: hypothetical protein C4573_04910 [Candidatus Woesearchaeota archaeon]